MEESATVSMADDKAISTTEIALLVSFARNGNMKKRLPSKDVKFGS